MHYTSKQYGHTAFEDNDPETNQAAQFSEQCMGESFPQDDKELDQAGPLGIVGFQHLEARRLR
jgi:hypothetical protein